MARLACSGLLAIVADSSATAQLLQIRGDFRETEAEVLAKLHVREPFDPAPPRAFIHPGFGHAEKCGDILHGEQLICKFDAVSTQQFFGFHRRTSLVRITAFTGSD